MKKFGIRLTCILLFAAMCMTVAPSASYAQGGVSVKNYFIKAGFDTMGSSFNASTGGTVVNFCDVALKANYSNYCDPAVAARVESKRISGASGAAGDYAPQLTLDKAKVAGSYDVTASGGLYLQIWPLAGAKTASEMVFEVDTKITVKGQITFQNIFDDDVNVFGADGKIWASNTKYAIGEWKPLRIELDYTQNKAEIYYDNTYCSTVDGISLAAMRSDKPVAFMLKMTTDEGLGFGVDNVALYETVTSEKIIDAGYKLDADIKSATTIPASARSIVLTMKDGFASDNPSASAKLLKDGVSVDASVTIADDTITITPSAGFAAGCDYTVLINESGTAQGAGYGVAYKVVAPMNITVRNYFIKTDFDECLNLTNQSVSAENFVNMYDILKDGNCSDYSNTGVISTRKYFRRVQGAYAQNGDYAFQTGVDAKKSGATTAELGEGTKLQLWPLDGAKTASKLIFEMDTKISSDGRIRFQNVFNDGNVDVFQNTGYIYGNKIKYVTGEWKKLRIEFDYTSGINKADIYYDGELCGTIANVHTGSFRTAGKQMVIRLNEATATGFDFAIDNLSLYEEASVSNLYGVGYAMADGIAKPGNISEAIVPAGAKSIVLSMAEDFGTSNPNATVALDGEAVSITKSCNNLVITPAASLTAGNAHTLFVNETASKAGPGYEIDCRVCDVNKITLSQQSGVCKAELMLACDKETTCTIIFAHYTNDNELSSISVEKCAVSEGINKLSAQCVADGSADYVKVMCWTEMNTMTPVVSATE